MSSGLWTFGCCGLFARFGTGLTNVHCTSALACRLMFTRHDVQVNIGMQFVKAGNYGKAIRFLEAVIAQYRLEPVEEFCAGQIAIGEVLGLYDNYDAQLGICAQVMSWPCV